MCRCITSGLIEVLFIYVHDVKGHAPADCVVHIPRQIECFKSTLSNRAKDQALHDLLHEHRLHFRGVEIDIPASGQVGHPLRQHQEPIKFLLGNSSLQADKGSRNAAELNRVWRALHKLLEQLPSRIEHGNRALHLRLGSH